MEAVSKIYLKLRCYFKLWRLNLDLKSVSEDACLRSTGITKRKLMNPGSLLVLILENFVVQVCFVCINSTMLLTGE